MCVRAGEQWWIAGSRRRTNSYRGDVGDQSSALLVVYYDQARHSFGSIEGLPVAGFVGDEHLLVAEVRQQIGHGDDHFVTVAAAHDHILSENVIPVSRVVGDDHRIV